MNHPMYEALPKACSKLSSHSDLEVRHLLQNPAIWPDLNVNPEPTGTSIDPDSLERWYQELFGDSLMPLQSVESPYFYLHTND
jgi:hypothetical protein